MEEGQLIDIEPFLEVGKAASGKSYSANSPCNGPKNYCNGKEHCRVARDSPVGSEGSVFFDNRFPEI
jgi:hypothetical protein